MSKEYLEALKQVKNFLGYNYCSVDLPNELKIIEQALINYTNITKQIEEADYKSAIGLLVKAKDNLDSYTYNTILEALLKTQEQKKYLKWEDLEFDHEPKYIDVKVGDNKYTLLVGFNVAGFNLALLRTDKQQYHFLEADKQFFNDLHLEVVE